MKVLKKTLVAEYHSAWHAIINIQIGFGDSTRPDAALKQQELVTTLDMIRIEGFILSSRGFPDHPPKR